MKTRKLFISYRSSDSAKVDKISRDLSLLKHDDGTPRFTTWQDKHNLPPASPNWWDAIVDAIGDCDVFVFHLSNASLQSEVCRAELEYARKRNRPIIPVVLDGEFFLHPQSGKYDLPPDTWALVPEWLGQTQFIFYISTEFYSRFQTAIAYFERNWPRDISVPRPLNPDSKSVHGSNHALYSAACDYAERLAFAEAEKHFDTLVRRQDEDYADLAAQWLNLIRRYAELIEIVEHRSPAVVFSRKWIAYQSLFPNDFVEGIFDPKDFADLKAFTGDLTEPSRTATGKAEHNQLEIERVENVHRAHQTTDQELITKQSVRQSSQQLLPAPFDWIAIAKTGYSIAKYPVTNAQFAKFIEANGYDEQKWWTALGWVQRRKDGWKEPRFYRDKKWNGGDKPIVGVCWFEALAFCLWLSDVTGERITLPTEAQWQYAAQSDDGRTYPWGRAWKSDLCNCNPGGQRNGKTTPVTKFEGKGDSPFGVVDMIGNVFEWCLTDFENKTNDIESNSRQRVVRGGSWSVKGIVWFQCNYHHGLAPNSRSADTGFRLLRT